MKTITILNGSFFALDSVMCPMCVIIASCYIDLCHEKLFTFFFIQCEMHSVAFFS